MMEYTGITPADDRWTLTLYDAAGGVPAVGNYTVAAAITDLGNQAPRMDFSGTGRGCGGSISGNFQVLEIDIDGQGQVQRLAVDFEQTCLASSTPAPLHGSVRINSSLPIKP